MMIRNILLALLLNFAIGTQGLLAAPEGQNASAEQASTLTEGEAEEFMSGLGEMVVGILTDKSLSTPQRAARFREVLDTKFNMKSVAKFVLGRYWKQATKEERRLFSALFISTTAASYAARFQDYSSEKLKIKGSRTESDGGVMVLSQIVRPSGGPIALNWKLFKKKGEIRIYDVILEGISMGITQRSEFASVIQRGGGRLSVLLEVLAGREGVSPPAEEK